MVPSDLLPMWTPLTSKVRSHPPDRSASCWLVRGQRAEVHPGTCLGLPSAPGTVDTLPSANPHLVETLWRRGADATPSDDRPTPHGPISPVRGSKPCSLNDTSTQRRERVPTRPNG